MREYSFEKKSVLENGVVIWTDIEIAYYHTMRANPNNNPFPKFTEPKKEDSQSK